MMRKNLMYMYYINYEKLETCTMNAAAEPATQHNVILHSAGLPAAAPTMQHSICHKSDRRQSQQKLPASQRTANSIYAMVSSSSTTLLYK